MIAREYIDKNLQPLFTATLVEEAINYFIEHKQNETFIYNETQELLLLKFADVINEEETSLARQYATPFEFKINTRLHWSQLLTFFKTLEVCVLPAYDGNNEFIGLISKNHLVSTISDFITLEESGAIIQLQCDSIFYAASEVIRIAETHNTRVISLFTHHDNHTKKLNITLKITLQEVRDITATYERFGYEVTDVFMNRDFNNDVFADRYESLLRIFDLK